MGAGVAFGKGGDRVFTQALTAGALGVARGFVRFGLSFVHFEEAAGQASGLETGGLYSLRGFCTFLAVLRR